MKSPDPATRPNCRPGGFRRGWALPIIFLAGAVFSVQADPIERWFYFPSRGEPSIIKNPAAKNDGQGQVFKFTFEEYRTNLPRRSRELRRELDYLLQLEAESGLASGVGSPEKFNETALEMEKRQLEETLAQLRNPASSSAAASDSVSPGDATASGVPPVSQPEADPPAPPASSTASGAVLPNPSTVSSATPSASGPPETRKSP